MKNALVTALVALAAQLSIAPSAAAQVGSPYCFGVGCPCGNDDPAAGCGNRGWDGSTATGAALQHLGGSASTVLDDLVLGVSGMQGLQSGILYMGGAPIGIPFGDGLRCVGGGAAGVFRYGVQQSNGFGEFQRTGFVATSMAFPPAGRIVPGSTWYFQGWYRDPGGPCGSQFNLTNALPVTFLPTGGGDVDLKQLAGNSLAEYPWFEHVRAFNQGSPVQFAFDPTVHPDLVGDTADVYVVAAKTAAQWAVDPALTDVRGGGADTITFSGSDIQSSTYVLDAGTLPGTTGTQVGIGYDVVIDLNQNGVLDADEPIDGLSDEAGFYVVRDVESAGPYAVTEVIYSGGGWLGQDLYYPTNISSLGQQPLIVVSHGNGHNYQWYDHIGFHMASYGYVVMSHQNNTGPGVETASTTTLINADYFLGNLGTIAGGALLGHVDGSNMTWLGHSRGGEGVLRAYTRVFTGQFVPSNFDVDDIELVSSIAPVTHLAIAASQPEFVDYHLWVGSADADVNGFTGSWPFALMESAKGYRSSIAIQGAGHGAFHDGGGSLVATGPCLLTREEVHQIVRGHFLPLVEHYIKGDLPSKDFLWRQWESFKPIGAPTNACAIVQLDYRDGPAAGKFVIDDYESQTSTGTASSGGAVTFTVSNLVEGDLRDSDGSLSWTGGDAMNGMTRSRAGQSHRGVVFDWSSPAFYEIAVVPAGMDFSDDVYLSFRACQGSRHPLTTAVLEDLTFEVTLRDANGTSSSISCGAFGGGIEEPYQRTGSGIGAGWANEMETIRIRLTDFLTNGSGLDLSLVAALRFELGGAGASAVGRIGLDDVEVTQH